MLTRPKEIGLSVQSLRRKFQLQEDPIWIEVQARHDSEQFDCFQDVTRQVSEFGGQIVHGWQIWEWPKIMIEAEFHAVWKSPDGTFLDVSIKMDGESRILFIPDPTRVYQGRQLCNLSLALWKNNLVHAHIATSKQMFELLEKGRVSELEFKLGPEFEILKQRKMQIESKILSYPRSRAAPLSGTVPKRLNQK